MKLNPPPRQKLKVFELARELGWTSRQLLAELSRRGEFVKSAASQLEAPVVRAIRQEFGAVGEVPDADAEVAPEMYGRSAETFTAEGDTGFAEELSKAMARSNAKGKNNIRRWRPPILQALLDEVIVPQRPEHLDVPEGEYLGWEQKKAAKLNARWAEAQLNGLSDDDVVVIKWIRLSDGHRPDIAAALSDAGISPDEATLCIGHGGRIDPRLPSIYERFRNRSINRTEAVAMVRQWRQWRQRQLAG
jgi:Translation initiation factor IF-2, N-terminal region